ncbi:MAG: hypothetical protein ACLT33_07305 [Lachnospira pectinoschiza]
MAVINILEDDEVIRGQLSQLLRDKGYEVIESADISSFNKIDSENTDYTFRCVFTRRRWI